MPCGHRGHDSRKGNALLSAKQLETRQAVIPLIMQIPSNTNFGKPYQGLAGQNSGGVAYKAPTKQSDPRRAYKDHLTSCLPHLTFGCGACVEAQIPL